MSSYKENFVNSLRSSSVWQKMKNSPFGHVWGNRALKFFGMHPSYQISGEAAIVDKDICLKMRHPDDNEKFSVLLVNVPLPSNVRHKRIIPMGSASLAAYVVKKLPDVNIGILDAHVQDLTYFDIVSYLNNSNRRWDIIGMGYWTVQAQFAQNLSKAIRSIFPDTVLIHGGMDPTARPEPALKAADYVCIGEGEITFVEFIEAVRDKSDIKNVSGIAYINEGKPVFTKPRELMKNLDDIPAMDYSLLPIEKYNMPLHVTGGARLPIMGSRGCPYECSFCASPIFWERKVRFRSPKLVVDEMQQRIDDFGINKFHFWDDNLTINIKWIKEVCEEIVRRKMDIEWVALDRADHINRAKDLLPLLKESGCIGIEIGLESANPYTFIHIKKKQGVDEGANAIKSLNDAGIIPLYTCMAFNPGETIVGYYFQKEFLDNAQEGYSWHNFFHPFPYKLYTGQFATAYPGTLFEEEISKKSKLIIEEPEDRYHHQINTIPFSLLNDVPIRTVDKITSEMLYIWLDAIRTAFWSYFTWHDTASEFSGKLDDARKFFISFFNLCGGRLTVNQIAIKLAHTLNYPEAKSYRYTAFAIYIFSQMGYLRSALYYTDLDMPLRSVRVPRDLKGEITSLLKLKGVNESNITIA